VQCILRCCTLAGRGGQRRAHTSLVVPSLPGMHSACPLERVARPQDATGTGPRSACSAAICPTQHGKIYTSRGTMPMYLGSRKQCTTLCLCHVDMRPAWPMKLIHCDSSMQTRSGFGKVESGRVPGVELGPPSVGGERVKPQTRHCGPLLFGHGRRSRDSATCRLSATEMTDRRQKQRNINFYTIHVTGTVPEGKSTLHMAHHTSGPKDRNPPSKAAFFFRPVPCFPLAGRE